MSSRLVLVSACLFLCANASATTEFACGLLLRPVSAKPSFATLQRRIRDRHALVRALIERADFPSITSIQTDRGNSNEGVFRVRTARGTAALKVYHTYSSLEKAEASIIMQNYLAELGLAPRILAVIAEPDMRRLAETDPEFRRHFARPSELGFALVMEEVPGAWLLGSPRAVPEIKSWDPRAIAKQLIDMEETLSTLQILPNDIQFLVTREGRIFLFDMDRYDFIARGGYIYGFQEGLFDSATVRARLPIKSEFAYTFIETFARAVRRARSEMP